MNGILCINKNKNVTSRDVVNELCKILKTKKIGHTGTLDPIATGVLVMGVNSGTKLIELITAYDKEYEALIQLGVTSDTYDITGNILNIKDASTITLEEIDKCLANFTGTYLQEVPKYSAVKINGKKLYQYARNNEDIILPKREITISSLTRISDIICEDNKYYFSIRCSVTKGTYIRSLINDIGSYLNVGAIMVELKRTRQGNFKLEDCYTIEDIKNNNYQIIPIEKSFYGFDKVIVDETLREKIIHGSIIDNIYQTSNILFITKDNEVLALYKVYEKDNTKMKPWKMFKTLA